MKTLKFHDISYTPSVGEGRVHLWIPGAAGPAWPALGHAPLTKEPSLSTF